MKIRLIRRPDGLYEPFDNETEEAGKKIPYTNNLQYIEAEFKIKRNYANHKRWFAFVKHTFEMQDNYHDIQIWRGVLQIIGGHCKCVVDRAGKTHIWPESIAWNVFEDESLFSQMFKRAVDGFIKNYGNGMSEDELLHIIDFEQVR